MDPAQTMAESEQQQCDNKSMNDGSGAAFWVLGAWKTSTLCFE
jgi:hypothetical protein